MPHQKRLGLPIARRNFLFSGIVLFLLILYPTYASSYTLARRSPIAIPNPGKTGDSHSSGGSFVAIDGSPALDSWNSDDDYEVVGVSITGGKKGEPVSQPIPKGSGKTAQQKKIKETFTDQRQDIKNIPPEVNAQWKENEKKFIDQQHDLKYLMRDQRDANGALELISVELEDNKKQQEAIQGKVGAIFDEQMEVLQEKRKLLGDQKKKVALTNRVEGDINEIKSRKGDKTEERRKKLFSDLDKLYSNWESLYP